MIVIQSMYSKRYFPLEQFLAHRRKEQWKLSMNWNRVGEAHTLARLVTSPTMEMRISQ
jgi:hypothetical protein